MTATSALLRQIFTDARPLVERALDLSEQFAAFRELATQNGLDWSQIKALLKAQVQDERADDGKSRVGRIIEKADFATAYADMLGLGTSKMNENNFSADLPPHDEDGVIIEPDGLSGPSSEEGADAIALDAPSSQIKSNAKATEVEPGNAGGTVPVRHNNDRAGVASRLAGGRTPDSEEGGSCALGASPSSPINSEIHREPSNRDVSADGEASSAAASQGQAAHAGTGSETLASHEGHSAGEGDTSLSPSISQPVALSSPAVTAAPGVPAPRVELPGAPIPCEANGWAGLEPLPQFDRREKAA